MLIRFQVSNFLSFREQIEFSMIPGKTRQHVHHVIKGEGRYGIDVLRAAAIYGANASGKSNLVKAIHFARNLVVEGTKPKTAIDRIPFKLDSACAQALSKFAFEIKAGAKCYAYGFELDSHKVHSEWLYEIKKTTETLLFERKTDAQGKTQVEFGSIKLASKKERQVLEFVALGTRSNQLFLNESIDRNLKYFEEVYNWFKTKLIIIFPSSHYLPLGARIIEDKDLSSFYVKYLEILGTGVCGFELQEIVPESEFPEILLSNFKAQLLSEGAKKDEPSGNPSISVIDNDGQRIILRINEHGELAAFKLMLKHMAKDCNAEVLMDISEESDGTSRIMELLPVLSALEDERVFIIDELDRSLHPRLSYELLELFLASASKSQLIATTHEAHLLDFDLLRRDEIWFIEKDESGASHVYSLEEFTPRYDKDIQKGYLLGRFGAIPIIGKVAW